jgi:hypothetical protein
MLFIIILAPNVPVNCTLHKRLYLLVINENPFERSANMILELDEETKEQVCKAKLG